MVSVRVRGIKSDPGFAGSTPEGTVTVSVIVRSEELGRFEIGVQVPDRSDEKKNVEEARTLLQQFSQQFSEALKQPLAFE